MNLPEQIQWLADNQPVVLALIKVVLVVVPLLLLVPGFIWLERRLLSWMQDRLGPNRAGRFPQQFKNPLLNKLFPFLRGKHTWGLLQPIMDGIKLFLKEDQTPSAVDKFIYLVAPAVALFPAFALAGTLPWGPDHGVYGLLTPIWGAEIGILYVLAISSLGVYGVVLAGYASNNKYSLLGGLRSAAQLISYELAMSVSLAAVVMATGSLKLTEMVKAQEGPLYGIQGMPIQNWFIFTPWGFVSAVIFLICMIAETNRAPFDLPEAENEIIAGYHTEYSSMKFAVFFMGEYAAMFVFGLVFATVFLGGYNPVPFIWPEGSPMASLNYWLAPLNFIGKGFAAMMFYIWLRATLPRLRYDQLMALGWKSLLPAAVANFIIVAIWIMFTKQYGPAGGWAAWGAAAFVTVGLLVAFSRRVKPEDGFPRRTVEMTDGAEPQPTRRSVELV